MDYIDRTREAIRANPPPLWPAYAIDPVGVWRYVARCVGAGFTTADEARRNVGRLYSIVVEACLRCDVPVPVNAAQVATWALEAFKQAEGQATAHMAVFRPGGRKADEAIGRTCNDGG